MRLTNLTSKTTTTAQCRGKCKFNHFLSFFFSLSNFTKITLNVLIFFLVFSLSLEKICFNFENFIFSFLYLCVIVSCNTKLPQMENDLMEIRINPSDFLFEDDFETIKKEPMENSRQEDLTASPIIAEFIIRQKCGPQTLITRTIPKPPMMWNTNSSFIENMIQFGVSKKNLPI